VRNIDPVAWVVAILLYALLCGLGVVLGVLWPWFDELWRASPRLGAVAALAFWLSPVVIVATLHHLVSGVLDARERAKRRARGVLPGIEAWWAGCFAWCTIAFASTTASIVMLILSPPDPPPDALAMGAVDVLSRSAAPSAYSIVWILLAGIVTSVERAARGRSTAA
jgi:hypothetical protein